MGANKRMERSGTVSGMTVDKTEPKRVNRNGLSFWEDTVTGSMKSGKLGHGKRLEAICKFFKIMYASEEENYWKEEVLAELETVLIDAPPLIHKGLAYVDKHGDVARVYLSPMLEFESLNRVVFVVAHEFAHIYLKHHRGEDSIAQPNPPDTQHEDKLAEKEADNVAEKWGFKPPRRNGRGEKAIMVHLRGLKSKRAKKQFAAAVIGVAWKNF